MNLLSQLDALCVENVVVHAPISFAWGGVDYTGTGLNHETWRNLEEGGFISNKTLKILVPATVYGDETPPDEDDILQVYVDANGIPCQAADDGSTQSPHRIKHINRSGGGISYELRTDRK